MNILLINYEYPPIGGGAGNATKELGRAIKTLGHKVTILTSRTPKIVGQSVEEDILVYRLNVLRRVSDRSNIVEMTVFLLVSILKGVSICRKNNIHAVICFFSLPVGPVGWFLNKMIGVPYIISLRGGDVPGLVPELSFCHRILRVFRRQILRNAIAIVANSNSLAEYSRIVDPFKIQVIPNGVDTKFYYPISQPKTDTAKHLIRLVFVGRFQGQKNLPNLITMLAEARSHYKIDFHLTLVGDGPELKATLHAAKSKGLADAIDWRGWVDKATLRRIYQQSDCLINLSLYEGSPNVILEAMASGLVVIASDIAPHKELIQHGETGILVPLSKSTALGETLSELAIRPDKIQRIAINARQEVELTKSWRKTAETYMKCFGQTMLNN